MRVPSTFELMRSAMAAYSPPRLVNKANSAWRRISSLQHHARLLRPIVLLALSTSAVLLGGLIYFIGRRVFFTNKSILSLTLDKRLPSYTLESLNSEIDTLTGEIDNMDEDALMKAFNLYQSTLYPAYKVLKGKKYSFFCSLFDKKTDELILTLIELRLISLERGIRFRLISMEESVVDYICLNGELRILYSKQNEIEEEISGFSLQPRRTIMIPNQEGICTEVEFTIDHLNARLSSTRSEIRKILDQLSLLDDRAAKIHQFLYGNVSSEDFAISEALWKQVEALPASDKLDPYLARLKTFMNSKDWEVLFKKEILESESAFNLSFKQIQKDLHPDKNAENQDKATWIFVQMSMIAELLRKDKKWHSKESPIRNS